MDKIDKITLDYLLNPSIIQKINLNNNNNNNNNNLEKYIKYKKKILDLTENMFNNIFINNEVKDIFNTYCNNLIYYIENDELKQLIQKEYEGFKSKQCKLPKYNLDVSNYNLYDISLNLDINKNYKKQSNNLKNFVIKNYNNKNNNKNGLPKKKLQN